MTAKRSFGLLLVGGSHTHQENYARSFAADHRCRLIGLTDETGVPLHRRALNLRLAGELNIPYLDDLDAALSRDDVDLACVCVEPERRGRVCIRAAAAGKHLYIDKPITASVADARAVVAAVAKHGVLSQMFSLVRAPVSERARQAYQSGRLGTPIGLSCELLFAKGIAGTADLSSIRKERLVPDLFEVVDAKRELYCVGVYPLVLFQWLTGGRMTKVFATTSNYFFAEHQKNDFEDFSCLLFEMDNGITGSIVAGRTGWSSHPDSGIHLVRLAGSEAVVTIDAFRPRLEMYCDARPWTQPERPHPRDPMGFWSSTVAESGVPRKTAWWPIQETLAGDMSYFLDCIETGRESDVPAATGAHAVEVLLAAYRSAATGAWVQIKDEPRLRGEIR